ncbi:hypothetical protein RKE25_22890 (plasmid) [Dyella sp. BiH032]|uniref:hypothetical protein n=1 Tax=Dyella sp. BiH032 TaxID=3075430 RepID=UPI0028935193|nr:hypothetical protein [Dyella sp. BiH032]WNL48383.1 hypothetical protein RKE25_22890 [Dyella sp. BiH032]
MSNPKIDNILADPGASNWLKDALRSALTRDPVDAANDASTLKNVLEDRCDEVVDAAWDEHCSRLAGVA